jgi:hypothetical protein
LWADQNCIAADIAPESVFWTMPMSDLSAMVARIAASKIATVNEVIILVSFDAVFSVCCSDRCLL